MKKRILTRKAIALLWVLFVVLLLVLAWGLLPWDLTPEAVHQRELKYRAIGETETVCEMKAPDGTSLLFTVDDRVVTMGAYKWLGWFRWSHRWSSIAEREPDRPFTVDYMEVSSGDMPMHPIDYYYVFGVIQDDQVEQIEINFRADTGGHDQTVVLTRDDWSVTDTGERYFLWELEPEVENFGRAIYATGYLEDGTATQTYYMTSLLGWE